MWHSGKSQKRIASTKPQNAANLTITPRPNIYKTPKLTYYAKAFRTGTNVRNTSTHMGNFCGNRKHVIPMC